MSEIKLTCYSSIPTIRCGWSNRMKLTWQKELEIDIKNLYELDKTLSLLLKTVYNACLDTFPKNLKVGHVVYTSQTEMKF